MNQPGQLKTLIFDLGNVLIFYCPKRMCRQIAQVCSLEEDVVKNVLFESDLGEKHERGLISVREFYDHFCTLTGTTPSYEELIHAGRDIFWPNRDLISQLSHFKQQNIQLLLLSNTCDLHFDYIFQTYPIFQHFDSLILSHKVGMRKPEPSIYEHALSKACGSPEECLFVDDLEANVEGARAAGLPAHQFTDTPNFLSHLSENGMVLYD